MKKLFTFTFAILALSLVLSAQSFEVYDHNDVLLNGQTVVVPTAVNSGTIFYYWDIKNVSSSQKDVRIEAILQTTLIDGVEHSICTPNTESSNPLCAPAWVLSAKCILNAGERAEDGDFQFVQGSNGGITTIEYKVYDENNESDYITFTITYSTLTSVTLAEEEQFTVFPNPAVNSFVISNEFGHGSYVEVYNVLGMQVSRVDFSNVAEAEIDCSAWEKGYYFCRLYNNGQVEKTIKLTVTH